MLQPALEMTAMTSLRKETGCAAAVAMRRTRQAAAEPANRFTRKKRIFPIRLTITCGLNSKEENFAAAAATAARDGRMGRSPREMAAAGRRHNPQARTAATVLVRF